MRMFIPSVVITTTERKGKSIIHAKNFVTPASETKKHGESWEPARRKFYIFEFQMKQEGKNERRESFKFVLIHFYIFSLSIFASLNQNDPTYFSSLPARVLGKSSSSAFALTTKARCDSQTRATCKPAKALSELHSSVNKGWEKRNLQFKFSFPDINEIKNLPL